ncbi:MAG TPA: DUF1499 domain-containing protein [Rhizomicrobium sp.]|nr:DUF1499 domain-containing protein [Rhizomicrobium sp.]
MQTVLTVIARLSFAALLISITIAAVAGLGTRFGIWNYDLGLFGIFPWCLYVGLAALAFGFAWMATAFLSGAGTGAFYGVIGFVGALAVLWVPLDDLYLANVANALPPIHDISTDTEHAPAFITTARAGATNPAAYDGQTMVRFDRRSYTTETLQKLYYGEIKPHSQLGTTPAKLFKRALAAARNMGWTIVAVAPDAEGGRIQASDRTLLFGFTDDIVIRVRPAGIGARLDIRSESRVGVNDFGRNAARIHAYINRLATT